MPNSKKQDLTI